MASSGLLDTVNLYTRLEADFAHQVMDIVLDISDQTAKGTKLLEITNKLKAGVRGKYEAGSDAYKEAMEEIQDEYELSLSFINQWESELKAKKTNLETQAKCATQAKEGAQAMLKQNVPKDNTWGGSGGGAA